MREILEFTNRSDRSCDVAIRFAEQCMLRHIGDGGYFVRSQENPVYERCGDRVISSHNLRLFQKSSREFHDDNNSSSKKLVGNLAALFKRTDGRLTLGFVVANIGSRFVVEAYEFIVNERLTNLDPSIFFTCWTDLVGNYVTRRSPVDDFVISPEDQIFVEEVFDMSHPPIFSSNSRNGSYLCVNKSCFGTLWWLYNTTPNL